MHATQGLRNPKEVYPQICYEVGVFWLAWSLFLGWERKIASAVVQEKVKWTRGKGERYLDLWFICCSLYKELRTFKTERISAIEAAKIGYRIPSASSTY